MKQIGESTGALHRSGSRAWIYCQDTLLPKIQGVILQAWATYSKPVPSSCNELLTLFGQCSCIAMLTGGLFYNWMFSSLEYSSQPSSATAASFSVLLLLALFLVHPLRCAFTMIVPTLGTKQGQRLLLSTCFMIVAAHVLPNILDNIKSLLQVIKCVCENSSNSLLNSTALLGTASRQFGRQIKEVMDNTAGNSLKPMNGHFQFAVDNSSSVVRAQVLIASQKIKEEFSAVELLVKQVVLVANRTAAGFFVLCLLWEAVWYLKCYLTDLRFDNVCVTKKLKRLAGGNNAAPPLTCSPKIQLGSAGLKLSREEIIGCLMRMMLLTLTLLLTAAILAMDYIAFHLADTAVKEVAVLPMVPITLSIQYDAKLNILPFFWKIFNEAISGEQFIKHFERTYQQNLTFVSADCTMKLPTPPNNFVALAVGLLYCIIYSLTFLETYAQRLCRKISDSFFQEQEEQRAQYLYKKLLRKHNRKMQKL